MLVADPADCADETIKLEKYSSMEIKNGNAFCMLKLLMVIL